MKYKDLILFYPKIRKQVINMQRWKILRNCFIFVIYFCLIFGKPDWCENLSTNVENNCERQSDKGYQFFTQFNHFINIYDSEVLCWFFMLCLIIYDLFLVDFKSRIIFTLCIMFILDILLGFLYLNDIMLIKFNTVVRLCFLIYYPRYTRTIMFTFFKFIYKVRKIFMLYLAFVVITGLTLFVLYFDVEDEYSNIYYSKLNFKTIQNSIYSSYTIFTF